MTAIAADSVQDDSARLRVLDAIKTINGPVTVSDVVARTGLPPFRAEEQLSDIVKEYESELDVDEEGNLVYRFEPGPVAREDIVKKDASRRRKERFRQGFIAFFKAWTVAMVIVYFIIYVALIIAALVAASQGRNNNSSSGRRRGGGMFWLMFSHSTWGYGGYGTHRSRRRRRRAARDLQGQLERGEDPYSMSDVAEAKKPGIVERTWYYLFGTRGIARNPMEQEKELLTYIRAKKGFISNADIIALLGVTYDEADKIGTRLVATYEGEMDITDEGVAIYRFPNLLLTGAPEVAEQTPDLGYLWQVRKKEHTLRKNPVVVLPILNTVNMVLAFAVWFWAMPTLGISGIGYLIGLVFFPLLFSICFFAIAMRRKMRESADKTKYQRDNIRISIYQELFTKRRPVVVPSRALEQSELGPWPRETVLAVTPDIAAEIRGTAKPLGDKIEIRADRIWREMGAVDKLRASAQSTRSVGRTVFSSAEGRPSPDAGSESDALAAEIEALEAELSEEG